VGNLKQADLCNRLDALYEDLASLPVESACPWPVARIFNDLLKQSKPHLEDDPVITPIALIQPPAEDTIASTAPVGSLRVLVDQIRVALRSAPSSFD
jgi:hypothetical protein